MAAACFVLGLLLAGDALFGVDKLVEVVEAFAHRDTYALAQDVVAIKKVVVASAKAYEAYTTVCSDVVLGTKVAGEVKGACRLVGGGRAAPVVGAAYL